MKYGKIAWGKMEALLNVIGGIHGMDGLLSGRLIVKERDADEEIRVDRSKPFDPGRFDKSIKMLTVKERDSQSFKIVAVPLSHIALKTTRKTEDGDSCISGCERIKRLKESGYIRLDAKFFLKLWANPSLIPNEWKEISTQGGNRHNIAFDGTILQDKHGNEYVLALYWGRTSEKWEWTAIQIAPLLSDYSAVLVR